MQVNRNRCFRIIVQFVRVAVSAGFIAAQTGGDNNHILIVHFFLDKKAFVDLFQAILIDLDRASLVQIRLCANQLCSNRIGVILV